MDPYLSELKKETIEVFEKFIKQPDCFPALATCETLMQFLNRDTSETFLEFSKKMTKVADTLKEYPVCEVESVSEIFIRFTTLKSSEFNTIQEARKTSQERGKLFLTKVKNCVDKIAKHSSSFITDDAIILVHSYSKAVLKTLLLANSSNKRFTVYVTKCFDDSGSDFSKLLLKAGIEAILIDDSAIGFYMEKIDIVLTGADGVVENGGIINKVGTLPLALCAKAMNKPFYVLVESYKFVRFYPVSQNDIPERIKFKDQSSSSQVKPRPTVDYTPPDNINLLLTDLGTLTTAAVSDVLINLYL